MNDLNMLLSCFRTKMSAGRLLKKRKSSSEEGEEAGDRELGVGLLGSRGEAEGKN